MNKDSCCRLYQTRSCFFYLFFFFIFSFSFLHAQTKQDLEKKKQNLLNEINEMQKELSATSKSKKLSLTEIKTIQAKITARQKLINNYNGQLNQLDNEITKTNTAIQSLDNDLNELKANYAKMVVYAYKHRSAYDQLLFIFSAESFNDAFRRFLYLRRYSAYRKTQADLIKQTKTTLDGKVTTLETQKKDKTELLAEQQQQKDKLQKEKAEKDNAVKKLTGQEKKIKAGIAAKKKEQEKLNKQIQELIKKEIAAIAAKNAAKNKSESSSKTSSEIKRTPEVIAMSNSFAANRGKFPWPVEHGIIIESFGSHPHPVLKNVTTKNNGVDIKTNAKANVRTIFGGTVVNVLVNPGYHKAVLIRHGDYFTVYSNLETVTVKANDVVSAKQNIGTAYYDTDEKISMVHLEIWKGITLLDPEDWLAGR